MHRLTAGAAHLALSACLCFAVACSAPASPTSPTAPKQAAMPFMIDKLTTSFGGTVDDVIAVDGYVYVSVAGRWCVSLQKPIAVGDTVDVRAFGHADHFHSKKLDRDFASLWFAVVTVTDTQPQQQGEKS